MQQIINTGLLLIWLLLIESCTQKQIQTKHTYTMSEKTTTEIAILGGGCFWCVEAVMQRLKGVSHVEPGYTGGHVINPSYNEVCAGTTGHAEVVRVYFDTDSISFQEILEVFMTTHDPTTLNRQGADMGTQYRSAIFYVDSTQKQIANDVIIQLSPLFDNPIVTEVEPLGTFYVAEAYHHNYYNNNPTQGYCNAVINPKLIKLRNKHSDKLK